MWADRQASRRRSVAPSEAPASAAPSPVSPPPLTQSFTSPLHGISLSYPEGWTARAATQPWTDRPGTPQFIHPGFDVLHAPGPVCQPVPGRQVAADRRFHAGRVGRRAAARRPTRRVPGSRADRRRRRHRTDRGQRQRLRHGRGGYDRGPRLQDRALSLQRRSSRRRSLRPGVVRGGPCHRATESRGRRRLIQTDARAALDGRPLSRPERVEQIRP